MKYIVLFTWHTHTFGDISCYKIVNGLGQVQEFTNNLSVNNRDFTYIKFFEYKD